MPSTPAQLPDAMMRLPEIIDVEAVSHLAGELIAHGGRPLTLDASDVQRLGGLGLQVLLSARKTWAEDGLEFTVINPSPAFADAVELFGAAVLTTQSASGGASA
ncbi:MAG: STAS domain-containing protein [Caulobacteraceae bacterium]